MGGRHRPVQTLTSVLAYFASGEEWNEGLKYIHEQHDPYCLLKVYTLAPHGHSQYIYIEGELYSCA